MLEVTLLQVLGRFRKMQKKWTMATRKPERDFQAVLGESPRLPAGPATGVEADAGSTEGLSTCCPS